MGCLGFIVGHRRLNSHLPKFHKCVMLLVVKELLTNWADIRIMVITRADFCAIHRGNFKEKRDIDT
jgi:hypothetical protein